MAQKTIIQLVDDVDGKELKPGEGETISFALDGTGYEIDLSLKNADKFRGVLQDYIAAGRKVTGSRGRAKAMNNIKQGNAKLIREWAQAQGLDVPTRGRIPSGVREQYDAAN